MLRKLTPPFDLPPINRTRHLPEKSVTTANDGLEIKQSLTDLEKMFGLMARERKIDNLPGASTLDVRQSSSVTFDNASFTYEVGTAAKPDSGRPTLHNISFEIPSGKTVAVVAPSGSGKSTLARLLFWLYDVQQDRILIAGQDIKQVA